MLRHQPPDIIDKRNLSLLNGILYAKRPKWIFITRAQRGQ
jgi:hypothetical protein